MLTRLLAATALAVSALALPALTMAPAAQAATTLQTPCDTRFLAVRHEASADAYDFNRDGLECRSVTNTEEAGDNFQLSTAQAQGYFTRRFYSFGPDPTRPTSITFINTEDRTFGGFMRGQEDDPDFNNCRELCFEDFTYDANDNFYFDSGSGSTRVSLAYFEQHALHANYFYFMVALDPNASNVFSFRGSGTAPPPPGPTNQPPGQPSLRLGTKTTSSIQSIWSAPSAEEGGTPTSYTWAWRSSSGDTWSKNYPANDTRITSPFMLTGLAPNTSYTVTLTAINAAGQSTSAQQSGATLPTSGNAPPPPPPPPPSPPGPPAPPPPPLPTVSQVPSRPRVVSARRAGTHKARIRWASPLRGPVDLYQVRRKGRLYTVADARRRSLVVRGLVNGKRYTFAVRAHNIRGWSAWSANANVRPHS